MSLWASACLSYGPCARAGVYAPMASVRRVLNARVFIRASMVRHVGQPQRSRQAQNERRKRCAAATGRGLRLQGFSISASASLAASASRMSTRIFTGPVATLKPPGKRPSPIKSWRPSPCVTNGMPWDSSAAFASARATGFAVWKTVTISGCSCARILPEKQQEKADRVHGTVCDHRHPEVAPGGQVQETEHETAQPRGDHARRPLIAVTEPEENARDDQGARPRAGGVPEHACDPGEQVAAVNKFLPEGRERPRERERAEQKVDVARERAKEADVREPARQPGKHRLGNVQAEGLITAAGPDAQEQRATPIRA